MKRFKSKLWPLLLLMMVLAGRSDGRQPKPPVKNNKKDTAISKPVYHSSNPGAQADTISSTKDIRPLLTAATAYLKKSAEEKPAWDLFTERTEKLLGIGASLVGLIVSIVAFFKKDFFEKYWPLISGIGVFCFSALLAFLFSSFLQTIFICFFLVALIILLFFFIALKYIEFLEKAGFNLTGWAVRKLNIFAYLPGDPAPGTYPGAYWPGFIHGKLNWLINIRDQQIKFQVFELSLEGSFVSGFGRTTFKFIPSLTEPPGYKISENNFLIPVNIEITFFANGNFEKLKNIQENRLLVTETFVDTLAYHTFDEKAFKNLDEKYKIWEKEMQNAPR